MIRDLHAGRDAGTVDLGANTPIMGSLATMPVLRHRHEPGIHWLVCRVGATPDGEELASAEFETFTTEEGLPVLIRDGKKWWRGSGSGSGQSSAERLAELDQIITFQ